MIPYHKPYPLSYEEREDIIMKVDDVLESGQLTNGFYVRELEAKIQEMYNVKHCIATSNCTQGLLLCLSLDPSRYIEMPAFNWWSDKYIAFFADREVSYLDIDVNMWLCDGVSPNIQLWTFGNVGPSGFLNDASHCLGAGIKDIGDFTVFSLAPTKLVTSCEGGLIITDKKQAEQLREWRDKCCRMSELHAIVGLATLDHLDEIKAWKREVFDYYSKHIPGQWQEKCYDHNYNTIGFLNLSNLKMPSDIETRQYYEPLKRGLLNTEYVYKNIVCLPSFYGVDYKKIVKDILDYNTL